MDSTPDSPRPGSRSEKMKMGVDSLAHDSKSATGQNIGPEKRPAPNPDVPQGTSSGREAEFEHGKPRRGSAFDPEQ